MTLREWELADSSRSINTSYMSGRGQYNTTAKDPNGPIKVFNAFGDTEAEALENVAGQLGIDP